MQRALLFFKVSALAAVSLLALGLCVLVAQVGVSIHRAERGFSGVTSKLNTTLDKINRPCRGSGSDKADNCGTLALAGQTMANAGDLIKQSQYVERRESLFLDTEIPGITSRVNASLDNVDQATADLHPLLLAATARTNDLASLEANLSHLTGDLDTSSTATFGQVNATLANANTLITNPNIPIMLQHFGGISASADRMLFTADAVETKATYNYLHPSHNPVKRTWQAVSPFLLPAAQIGAATVR